MIRGIELIDARIDLVSPFRTSFGTQTYRDLLFVRVLDDDVEGWGECVAMSEPGYSSEYIDGCRAMIERFLLRERLMAEFKQRWTTEYLQERSQHFRRLVDRRGIRLGEIVIIQDETVKRQNWRMGVVVELFRGRDNKIRAVRVKTAFGDFKRPVQKLCSLEICEELQSAELSENGLEEGTTSMEAEPAEEDPDGDREPPSSGGEDVEKELTKTRFGRTVKPVQRLGFGQ